MKRFWLITLILFALAVIIFAVLQFFPVYSTRHIEIGTKVTVQDFLRFPNRNATFTSNSEEFDTDVPGTYNLEIHAGLFNHTCRMTVSDTTPPQVEVRDLYAGKEEKFTAEDFIVSVEDHGEVSVRYSKEPDLSLLGEEQEVELEISDDAGNIMVKRAKLTMLPTIYRLKLEVGSKAPKIGKFTGGEKKYTKEDGTTGKNYIVSDVKSIDYKTPGETEIEISYHGKVYPAMICVVDTKAPVFVAYENFTTYLGESIRYKSHVDVTDNSGDYKLEVDTSKVDPSSEGEYEVTYTAKDASGNSSSVMVIVTITEKSVDEQELFDQVDAILDGLITDDMSAKDKAYAIFQYVQNQMGFTNDSVKGDYVKSALRALTWGNGDCYVYFSLAKVMLTRAGIPNMDIERIPDGDEMHYWNLIDIGDGNGWYHFDCTPFEPYYVGFLMTVSEAMSHNSFGQYNYDHSKYPKI
ncbi:MAG: transglutaminase domain-containing protein, partial [Lachnospiraceae bacterium]|nr:transglutaminase domain-containing protein [Lachnospiraceae bacterium]